jgi:hypothetical protein
VTILSGMVQEIAIIKIKFFFEINKKAPALALN